MEKVARLYKNTTDPQSKEFWNFAQRITDEVKEWPLWKRQALTAFYNNTEKRTMEKLERDGKIAVVYSPGYGYGWSTMFEQKHAAFLTMDKRIVEGVLSYDLSAIKERASAHVPEVRTLWHDTTRFSIIWVPVGTLFYIHERDGSEYLVPLSGTYLQA